MPNKIRGGKTRKKKKIKRVKRKQDAFIIK